MVLTLRMMLAAAYTSEERHQQEWFDQVFEWFLAGVLRPSLLCLDMACSKGFFPSVEGVGRTGMKFFTGFPNTANAGDTCFRVCGVTVSKHGYTEHVSVETSSGGCVRHDHPFYCFHANLSTTVGMRKCTGDSERRRFVEDR